MKVLASADPAGTFTGHWIRVENISGAAYTTQVAEVQALSFDVTSPNVALYRPSVYRNSAGADIATYPGYPAPNINDGALTSFSHPDTVTAPATTLGSYYQIDLQTDFALDRVVLIRYTTNGTRPTETTGTVYSAPINVSTTTVIRAAACLAGAASSNVDTHTYIFPGSVATQPAMLPIVTGNATWARQLPAVFQDVPSISITTPNTSAFNNDTEIESAFEWIHHTDPLQHAHANCGVQYFGGVFTAFAKKSFRLYFRGLYGDKKLKANLDEGHEHGHHAVQEFDSLEIRNGSHDMRDRGFYMSNLFTDEVISEMGHLSPQGRFVHVYLNGSYWGLYHLRERWNAAMHSSYLGGQKEDYEAIKGNHRHPAGFEQGRVRAGKKSG